MKIAMYRSVHRRFGTAISQRILTHLLWVEYSLLVVSHEFGLPGPLQYFSSMMKSEHLSYWERSPRTRSLNRFPAAGFFLLNTSRSTDHGPPAGQRVCGTRL